MKKMSPQEAVGKHERNMHPGKNPTKFKKGGPTTDDRMRMGRGMSRAANQKTG
jgi:hypothetical protein